MTDPVTVVLVVLVWVVALAASVLGGGPVTQGVLRAAARAGGSAAPGRAGRPRRGAPADPAAVPVPPPPPPTTGPIGTEAVKALRGGTWIGILERFAITGCLLAGEPGGIAFVVAIKGLGRYPELREHPVASERFVIGTLASMCWAATLGVVANAVLAALR
ncbi:hypothetical protein SAMN05518682_2114 [Cellulosimicrobium aquatile]|uniref:Uncharacterized protein n=2 Tax=Cellulosimicrobium TaxID=157920 RepID=A0A1N6RTX4_9MICO|nr:MULTISPECIES: hypothetical protein [Cellulosimicrobium]MCM3535551.1 hypothetical protein [Cellulosimicrobium funkei]GLY58399.1 hypothetical protein Ccel01_30010 [Cellulosimicrobium cellulans]SIQ32314.1 hypothetical protein SAMN05518682_2114 [Cellulosimicrobium aquatile]